MNQDHCSMLRGARLNFDYKGRMIRVEFSTFTGSERIYVDGTNVCQHRTFRYQSTHPITLDDDTIQVQIKCVSILKGPMMVRLVKDEQVMQQKTVNVSSVSFPRNFFKTLAIYLTFGVVFGVISGMLNWPDWVFFVGLLGLLVVDGLLRNHLRVDTQIDHETFPDTATQAQSG